MGKGIIIEVIPPTRFTHQRNRSQECIESLVSVEKAAQLQDLSMKRFQKEAGSDMKLRRIIGHVSVNRRSSEIIQTAAFDSDVVENPVNFAYDEDAASLSDVSSIETASCSSKEESMSENGTQHWTQSPLVADIPLEANDGYIDGWEQYRPSAEDLAAFGVEKEAILNIDEDWMYDVLDLHVDYNALMEPAITRPIPKVVAMQVWRIILQSLAGLATRKSKPSYDIGHLEAHGYQQHDSLVGLGLQCHPVKGGWNESRLQIAT